MSSARCTMQKVVRMRRELQMLQQSPPPGVACSQDCEDKDLLRAQIVGGEGTPYYGGLFHLDITIPQRYPFEPPKLIFKTPIYHPNIDNGGRICLDTLKMPPQGAWKPSLNIGSVLTTIQLLMAEPNPDDPLMTDISAEFKFNRHVFNEKAKELTKKYAMEKIFNSSTMAPVLRGTTSSGSEDENRDAHQNVEEAECSGIGSNSRKRNLANCDHVVTRKRR